MKLSAILLAMLLMMPAHAAPQSRLPTTGTIRGRVHLTGKSPGNVVIRMGTDPKCNQMNRGKRVIQEAVMTDTAGNLANVFVRLEGRFAPTPAPSQPVTIGQKGCVYGPRVVGVRVGQVLEIRNDDPLLHNVHSFSTKRNDFNVGQATAGIVFRYRPAQEEFMLRLGCDIHRWMNAWVGVVSHPHFDVSGPDGTFLMQNVPAGTYVIHAWHERYGSLSRSVTVRTGATADIDFAYSENASGRSLAPAGQEGRLRH
jgi:hypothetical protein